MALGLFVAAALLIVWPICQAAALIKSLPWGGERELAPIVLVACVVLAFTAISPGVFTALDRTSLAALSSLSELRSIDWTPHLLGIFHPFDALRAAPFLFGGSALASEIWALDFALVLLTSALFLAGARIGGIFGGAAAVLLALLDINLRAEFRTFEFVAVLLAGLAVVIAALISVPNTKLSRGTAVLAAIGLGLVVGGVCVSGAALRTVTFGAAHSSVLSVAALALFGGAAVRWWTKGLRGEFVEWKSFNIGIYLLAIICVASALEMLRWHGVPVILYLAASVVCAILAGGVVGGFCRLLGVHALAVPALVILIAGIRFWILPFDPKRVGGFASTIDDMKAAVPAQSDLATSINPKLASEFLGRPVVSLDAIVRGSGVSEGPLMIEARFASRDQMEEISQHFRLVPVLPGIFRAYNLNEAPAPQHASERR